MPALETVVIGGGIAGLACARRLSDRGREFLLISDRLGGRMHAEGQRNFGATYITSDYRWVRHFVRPGRRIRKRDTYFLSGDRFRTLFHPRHLRHRRAIVTLYARLISFRRRLNRLRADAPYVCQAELVRRDPALERSIEEPASEFIARHGLEEINDVFTDSIVTSTVFVGSEQVNTFYYLATLMPILLPTYLADFSMTLARLTAGYEHRMRRGRVTAVRQTRWGDFVIATEQEEYRARNVVIATPAHNLRQFWPEVDRAAADRVREVPCTTLHVAGRRKMEYRPGKTVFLPRGEEPTVLFPVCESGCDILFAPSGPCDLSRYYEQPEIVGQVHWKTAILLSGGRWRSLCPRPNVYLIGDYNICGLEDSFLTGLFAAHSICGLAAPLPQPVQVPAGIHRVAGQVGV